MIKCNALISMISLVIGLMGCSKTTTQTQQMDKLKNEPEQASSKDTTPKVTGIGGIFFFTEDQKKTREWYAKNLGLEINEWGSSSFESRNIDNPKEINSLQWTPFKKGDAYFAPSEKEFMINYRVQNIEGLVGQLKQNGVTVLDGIERYDFENSFISWVLTAIKLNCGSQLNKAAHQERPK